MTFKEYQEKYIAAVRGGKEVELPSEMFDDFAELANMYSAKLKIVIGEFKKSKTIDEFEKITKVLDDLNLRALNVWNNYRQIVETGAKHNEKLLEKQYTKEQIMQRISAIEKTIQNILQPKKS